MIFTLNYINFSLILMNNCVIILASGDGTRMNNDIPKQFMQINNKMIIEYSIIEFLKNDMIDEIIVVSKQDWIEKIKKKYKNIKIVAGGKTRSESSYIGLSSCGENIENVLIHDAARPFVNQNLIKKCIENLKKYDAVVPIVACTDSVINCIDINYINRDEIKFIQTPQGFKLNKILNAYNSLDKIYADDFSVLLNEKKNLKYKFIKGSNKNIKLTKSEDLSLAKYYLNEK